MPLEHSPGRAKKPLPVALEQLRIISKAELLQIVPLSYVTLWAMMRRGEFPQSIRLANTTNAKVGWHLVEVLDWLENRERVTLKPIAEGAGKEDTFARAQYGVISQSCGLEGLRV